MTQCPPGQPCLLLTALKEQPFDEPSLQDIMHDPRVCITSRVEAAGQLLFVHDPIFAAFDPCFVKQWSKTVTRSECYERINSFI